MLSYLGFLNIAWPLLKLRTSSDVVYPVMKSG